MRLLRSTTQVLRANVASKLPVRHFVQRKSTVDDHEVENLSKMATGWWNTDGPQRLLHSLNSLR